MDDILIRGGQVIDGTGAPARVADVAIRAGRIVAIEADRTERLTARSRGVDVHGDQYPYASIPTIGPPTRCASCCRPGCMKAALGRASPVYCVAVAVGGASSRNC